MIKKLFSIFIILTLFASCTIEGCKDINSDNYDSTATKEDNSCLYRYVKRSSIIMPYSLFGVPDNKVFIKLFKKNDDGVKYVSTTTSLEYFSNFEFNDNFHFTNEMWTMQIWVIDANSSERNEISADFNPFLIQPKSEQNVLKFNTDKNQNLFQVTLYYVLNQ